MKYSELKELDTAELLKKSKDLRNEIFALRLRRSGEKLEDTMMIKKLKKDLARILTAVNEVKPNA